VQDKGLRPLFLSYAILHNVNYHSLGANGRFCAESLYLLLSKSFSVAQKVRPGFFDSGLGVWFCRWCWHDCVGRLVGHRMMLRRIGHGLCGFKLCSGRCVLLAVFVDPDVPGILHD